MEDRKLLDTHLREGQQESSNSIVTSIVVSWIFEISVSFHYYTNSWSWKSFIFNKFLWHKKQPIRQEERDRGQEGRNVIIFCMLYLQQLQRHTKMQQ